MTAIAAVVNGVTQEDAVHFNQYKDAFSNTFGVTDTNPARLGKIILPSVTSHPASPTTFQEWYRSDLGAGGRKFSRHSNNSGQNVPYLPYRQRVEASQAEDTAFNITTSWADITSLSQSITPTGGRLKIGMITIESDDSGSAAQIYGITAGGSNACEIYIEIRAVVGAVNLHAVKGGSTHSATTAGTMALTHTIPPPGYAWDYLPAVGSALTVKLQARVSQVAPSLAGAFIFNCRLVVEEVGDG